VSRSTHGWPANPECSAARERRIGVHPPGQGYATNMKGT
jgi:hypothetical protein